VLNGNIGPGLLKFVGLTEFDETLTLKLSQNLQVSALVDSNPDRHVPAVPDITVSNALAVQIAS
jgi:hypothetical protein